MIDEGEDCHNCPVDVGVCTSVCENDIPEPGETCTNCEEDIQYCSNTCGNGIIEPEF